MAGLITPARAAWAWLPQPHDWHRRRSNTLARCNIGGGLLYLLGHFRLFTHGANLRSAQNLAHHGRVITDNRVNTGLDAQGNIGWLIHRPNVHPVPLGVSHRYIPGVLA